VVAQESGTEERSKRPEAAKERYGRRHFRRTEAYFETLQRVEDFLCSAGGDWITTVTVVAGRSALEELERGFSPAHVRNPTVVARTAAAAPIFALDQRGGSGGGAGAE
jgi:hypothetical protein